MRACVVFRSGSREVPPAAVPPFRSFQFSNRVVVESMFEAAASLQIHGFCNQNVSAIKPIYNLDGPIRANRLADSRESLDSRESFRGSRIEPLFCESRFGG